MGSHLDTVLNGGPYDGALGVVAALETLRSFHEQNFIPDFHIRFIAFAEEEGSNFGVTCLGSKAITGKVDKNTLKNLYNTEGSAWEKLYRSEFNPKNLPQALPICRPQIKSKPDSVLGLATGSSPVGTYKELVKMYESGELDFSRISSINLDEYVGLDGTSDQSYRFFMNDNLFDHVNIDKSNTNVPNGKAEDRDAECSPCSQENLCPCGGFSPLS